ncbi:MAG: TlpA family protein disulfide reductase [Bacteroidetes bacterium]|nr:TlpA family protein disulfide reductase [Bacteroidota bacterium]
MNINYSLIFTLCFFAVSCSKQETAIHFQPQEVVEISASDVKEIIGSYAGNKAVLVNVWATWCIPCVEEFPYIVDVRNEFKNELEVVFISADFPEALERIYQFLGDNKVYWQTYLKNDRDEPFIDAVWSDWTGALPATVVYNTRGEQIAAFERPATFEEFRELAILATTN